jgi:PQQ-like domain
MTAGEVQRASVQYPGGLAARYRWAGSAQGEAVFAMSEAGGTLADHGNLGSDAPERACRSELRVEGPLGAWTIRLASPIFDEPQGLLWDAPGLLIVKYGFVAYGLVGRTGKLRWHLACGSPIVAVLGSSRLDHVLVQGEVETIAVRADGSVAWRAAHDEVVTEAELVGGRLVTVGYDGRARALDPSTGRPLG